MDYDIKYDFKNRFKELKERLLNKQYISEDDLAELISFIFLHLYKPAYEYITTRRVIKLYNPGRTAVLGLKVDSILRVAKMHGIREVYVRILNDEIICTKEKPNSTVVDVRKVSYTKMRTVIALTPFLKALGLKEKDIVIVKVKEGEFTISNPLREIEILERLEDLKPKGEIREEIFEDKDFMANIADFVNSNFEFYRELTD